MNANDLIIFAKAVEFGGFAQASKRLNIPRSTISKRVGVLEEALGVRLINRNSRNFSLTDIGKEVYDHARIASIEMENASLAVKQRMGEPAGTVRITVSVAMLHFELAHKLQDILYKYPKLHISVHATDDFIDINRDGFDMAVRSHFSPLPDSELIQRTMRVEPLILVASPDYLQKHGYPEHPNKLSYHHGLPGGMTCKTWHLFRDDGETISVTPKARVTVDEAFALVNAAVSGLGITILPVSYCSEKIKSGELIHILKDWSAGPFSTSILIPHRKGQLPGVKAVVEFLMGL